MNLKRLDSCLFVEINYGWRLYIPVHNTILWHNDKQNESNSLDE